MKTNYTKGKEFIKDNKRVISAYPEGFDVGQIFYIFTDEQGDYITIKTGVKTYLSELKED